MFLTMALVAVAIAKRRLPTLVFGGPGAQPGSLITPGNGPTGGPELIISLQPSGPRSAVPNTRTDSRTGADLAQSLERLAALHRAGLRSGPEFEAAKAALLNGDQR